MTDYGLPIPASWWIIRDKVTLKHLPVGEGRHGRGFTHVEPVAYPWPPRLFHTEAAAKKALTWWLKGETSVYYDRGDKWEDDVEEVWHTDERPDRKRKHMEIVRVRLEVQPIESAEQLVVTVCPRSHCTAKLHASGLVTDACGDITCRFIASVRRQAERNMESQALLRVAARLEKEANT